MSEVWAQQEMAAAAVWDRRCVRSLVAICERRLERPLVSFSKACGDATRQAAHRICSDQRTTVDGLLRGHFEQTALRCRQGWAAHPDQPVLVVQDTIELNYRTHWATEGLGPVNNTEQACGLFAHPALALPVEGIPFGLVHLSVWARDPATHGKQRKSYLRTTQATALKESQRWIDGVWGTEASLPEEIPVLVIADREADFYDYFTAERRPKTHLLVRAYHPRRVLVEEPEPDVASPAAGRLPEVLADLPSCGTFEIVVPRKTGQPERTACLEVRVTSVWILASEVKKADDALRDRTPRQLWVIEARESAPPEGLKPVHWVLLTTQTVADFELARRMVHYYTRRWVIEELALVLKSGLRAERLQMDDAATLKNTLALLFLVAWRVLHLRDVARFLPEEPAATLVSPSEHALLEATEGKPLSTVREVIRAIAHLAGFARYPSAGEPGVRTLWEGLQRLEAAAFGWRLAHGQ